MTRALPQIIHRYEFPLIEVIKLLLDDSVDDCEGWKLHVEGATVIVDVFEPTARAAAKEGQGAALPADGSQVAETAEPAQGAQQPAAELIVPRKGGAVAQKAGIICGERGLWTFLSLRFDADIQNAEDAAAWLRNRCGVESRAELDHDDAAAAKFRDVDSGYELWLDGFD